MTTQKPELDLPAIRARADAATAPEHWGGAEAWRYLLLRAPGQVVDQVAFVEGTARDAAFIAEARELVPALLDALEEARAEIERLTKEAQK